MLKPNVVFFGDNVPKATVEFCHSQVDAADAILVVGSSLEVYSAFRFIERALVMDPQDGEEEEREQQEAIHKLMDEVAKEEAEETPPQPDLVQNFEAELEELLFGDEEDADRGAPPCLEPHATSPPEV